MKTFSIIVLKDSNPSRYYVEQSCTCNKREKSPGQETGLKNRGRLKVLNDTKLILNDKGGHPYSFRTNSEQPSDVPYSPNQFLDLDFFDAFYTKMALVV